MNSATACGPPAAGGLRPSHPSRRTAGDREAPGEGPVLQVPQPQHRREQRWGWQESWGQLRSQVCSVFFPWFLSLVPVPYWRRQGLIFTFETAACGFRTALWAGLWGL